MTQLNEEHFELHSANKDKMYQEKKMKYLEDRVKTLEKSVERIHKIMARFQMTEGDKDNVEVGIKNGRLVLRTLASKS
jgi:hypothetical protein